MARPSNYHTAVGREAARILRRGGTMAEAADEVGVAARQLQRWRGAHAEFRALVEGALFARLLDRLERSRFVRPEDTRLRSLLPVCERERLGCYAEPRRYERRALGRAQKSLGRPTSSSSGRLAAGTTSRRTRRSGRSENRRSRFRPPPGGSSEKGRSRRRSRDLLRPPLTLLVYANNIDPCPETPPRSYAPTSSGWPARTRGAVSCSGCAR